MIVVSSHLGVINVWERAPYISDIGLVRNFTKDAFNTTSAMPSLQQLQAGYTPGFDPAPPGVGSAVSAMRRVHHNILMANYNAEVTVTLDDGSSRFLTYSNLLICESLSSRLLFSSGPACCLPTLAPARHESDRLVLILPQTAMPP